MRFLNRKSMIVLLALMVVAITTAVAQEARFPTYEYYGRVLGMDEFLKLVETEVELHCIQLPSIEVYLDDRAVTDYACFNTEEERIAYGNVLDAEWERIARLSKR